MKKILPILGVVAGAAAFVAYKMKKEEQKQIIDLDQGLLEDEEETLEEGPISDPASCCENVVEKAEEVKENVEEKAKNLEERTEELMEDVSDNIEEHVEDAAKAANCHDFIMQLEQGYDTLAGDAGDRLSGGERQRITIARAMLKPSSVVILDEATAYADPENEALIQQAISKLVAGKTLIVVAHRLNTIRNADQILVVANGNIAGRGTQEELLRECPIYQKMWQDYAGTIEEADLKGGVENHA